MFIPLLLSITVALLYLKLRVNFIHYAPLMIILEPMLGTRSRVEAGALVYYVIAACLILWSVDIILRYKPTKRITIMSLYWFLFAMFIHYPLAEMNVSLIKRTLVLVASYLVLPAALRFYDSKEKLILLIRVALISLVALVIYLIVVSLLKYGESPYGGISYIYMGNYDIFTLSCLAILIILFPAIAYYTKWTIITNAFAVAALLILILITKRNFLIMTIIPLLYYFTRMKLFRDFRKSLIPAIILIGFGYIGVQYTSSMIADRYYSREKQFQVGITEQNRTTELAMYDDILTVEKHQVLFLLFGRNYFNTAGNFDVLDQSVGDYGRNWHSGIANILYGMGTIGVIVFLFLWGRILSLYRKGSSPDMRFEQMLLSSQTMMIIICTFIISTFEAISSLHSGAIPLLFMGAFIGYRYHSNTAKI